MNEWILTEYLDSLVTEKGVPGCQCSVYVNHDRVFSRTAGFRDDKAKEPSSPEDLYWIYSVSKLFTCVAAMQLIERGMLRLEDSVSRYLPSWSEIQIRRGKKTIPSPTPPTILHLMTMTAGLNYKRRTPAIRTLVARKGLCFTLRELADTLANQPLDFEPGTRFRYSLCHDVLGAVIEVASGTTIEEYMRENIADPLGAKDLTFFPDTGQFDRFAAQFRYLPDCGKFKPIRLKNPYILSPAYASTGAGLCAGIRDIALLADALANGGVGVSGNRILTPVSIRRMTEDALNPIAKRDFQKMKPAPYSYGLGVRTMIRGVNGATENEFGWDGAAGSYVLIDPDRHMSLVYTQHVLNHGPVYAEIHPGIRNALYRSFGEV
ncbi:MAG: serine hydrolase [Oscillospiraceae bacterium]|nr:serine hydrolase [Oscillospiraceae bacterium]